MMNSFSMDHRSSGSHLLAVSLSKVLVVHISITIWFLLDDSLRSNVTAMEENFSCLSKTTY